MFAQLRNSSSLSSSCSSSSSSSSSSGMASPHLPHTYHRLHMMGSSLTCVWLIWSGLAWSDWFGQVWPGAVKSGQAPRHSAPMNLAANARRNRSKHKIDATVLHLNTCRDQNSNFYCGAAINEKYEKNKWSEKHMKPCQKRWVHVPIRIRCVMACRGRWCTLAHTYQNMGHK